MLVLDDCAFTSDWATLSKAPAALEAGPRLHAVLDELAPLR